jgi:hypothetical protein
MPPLEYEGLYLKLFFSDSLVSIFLTVLTIALIMSIILMAGHFYRLIRR